MKNLAVVSDTVPYEWAVAIIGALATAIVVLFKIGQRDSRRALEESYKREREANAERAQATAAVIESIKWQTKWQSVVAERLDAIESRLGIVMGPSVPPSAAPKEPSK